MYALENFFSRRVIKYRRTVIFITLVVVAACSLGIQRLSFDNDYRAFFSDDNPELLAYNKVEESYTKSDNIFILIAPNDGDVFKPSVLQAIEEMTNDAWQIPYSRRIDSLKNFQNTYAEEDDLIVEDLFEDAPQLTDSDIIALKKVAMSDPLLFKRMVSEDGRVTGLNITMEYPSLDKNQELTLSVEKSRQLVKKYQNKYPEISFHTTGLTFLNISFVEAGQDDVSSLVPLSFILMLVIMYLLLRSVSAVFGIMLVIVFSDIIALGVAGYIGIILTPASVSSMQMIMVLAVANSVHLLVSYNYALQHNMPKLAALSESIRINLQPIFLTSATTIIGFLCMNFSEAPPFHALGNIVAMGVLASFVLTLTFLPALMSYLPVRIKPQKKDIGNELFKKWSSFIIRQQRPILYLMAFITLASAYAATLNVPEEQSVKYFDEKVQFRIDTDFASETLGGLHQVIYSVPATGSGGISEPEYLKKLDQFATWYRKQQGVINVFVLTDTMRRLNKNMHGDDPDWYVLPESRELAAQYLLLYEMSLPYGLDLNNQVNVDKSASRMVVSTNEMSNIEIIALQSKAQSWLGQNFPKYMQSNGTGPMVMFAHISNKNIDSTLKGSILALFLISCILVFALKSLRIGIISLVPNLLPILIGFGIWGLLYVQINMGIAVVVSMALGIVVDDTVHLLSKYLRAKREKGYSNEQSITYAFTHVGKALVISTIVLSVGFSVLMTSTFAMNSGMATLTTWVIILALLVDFILLPVLLLKFDKDKK